MSKKTLQNSVMQVQRLNLNSQSDIGGIDPVIISVGTIPCRIRQLNADERFVGGKDGIVSTHRIYSSNKINIKNRDKIIIDKVAYDVNTINYGSYKKDALQIDVTLRN